MIGRAAPGWLWAFRALRGQSPVLFRTSEDVGYDVPPLLLLLHAIIHRVREIRILRSSHSGDSAKFTKNNALNGTKFIGDSSLFISMGGMENGAGPCPRIRRKGGRENMKRASSRPAIPICSAI
jgi:hypothetical protein